MIPAFKEFTIKNVEPSTFSYVNCVHRMLLDAYNMIVGTDSSIEVDQFFLNEEKPVKHDRLIFCMRMRAPTEGEEEFVNETKIELILTKDENECSVFFEKDETFDPEEWVWGQISILMSIFQKHGVDYSNISIDILKRAISEDDVTRQEGLGLLANIIGINYLEILQEIKENQITSK